jgi:hypothetical protein
VEEPILIDVELISFITGLPSRGENLAHYLDDKKKEKVLVEEMKKTYGTKRGSLRIIIKCISDTTTRLATKIMVCTFLRKYFKEEVLAEVITATKQCTKGTMLSWASYLLNLFVEDCRDAQDLGTWFHYSWILILITLIGWKEPQYTYFCEQTIHCRATWTHFLGSLWTPKSKVQMQACSMGITTTSKKSLPTLGELLQKWLCNTGILPTSK